LVAVWSAVHYYPPLAIVSAPHQSFWYGDSAETHCAIYTCYVEAECWVRHGVGVEAEVCYSGIADCVDGVCIVVPTDFEAFEGRY